jgi:two-component system, NarL family, vancomycin resistance associated response regulator VraR
VAEKAAELDKQTCVLTLAAPYADDDEDLRRVIRWFLESRTTCEVCGEAVNGLDAIEKARTLNPDLILLDYSMPSLNGIETGAVLKAMLPKVTLILFTTQDTRAIESAAISAGIQAVVAKTDIPTAVRRRTMCEYSGLTLRAFRSIC